MRSGNNASRVEFVGVELKPSLTALEVQGLNSQHNLADGHAYHDTPDELRPVIENVREIWEYATGRSVPQMELDFKEIFSKIIGSPTLSLLNSFSVLPTASNSIDVIGAWLTGFDYRVGLLEPAFDNLQLILKRRTVSIMPIRETELLDLDKLKGLVRFRRLQALFIVNPNNPTGMELSPAEFSKLCEFCASENLLLIVDRTFRFYSRTVYDDYRIMSDSGVRFMVIEDTGKTWSTQDLKVSLLVYSPTLAPEMRQLYEEIFLCSSNFTLALLGALIERSQELGLERVLWREVDRRKQAVGECLRGTSLVFEDRPGGCQLPFAWLDCSATGHTDIEVVEAFRGHHLALLPGRFFFWSDPSTHTNNIRVSFMKPKLQFYSGIEILKKVATSQWTPQKKG